MKKKILKNALVLTLNNQDECLKNSDVLIEGDTIKEIRSNIDIEGVSEDCIIDCTDKIIMPGLVNAHMHSDENFFKGMFDNLPLELWMLYAYPRFACEPISERLLYLRTLLGGLESLHSGVTSIQDDLNEMPDPTMQGHRMVIQAYKDLGLRCNVSIQEVETHLCDNTPYMREILPVDIQKKLAEPKTSEVIYKRAEEMIQEWHNKENVKIVTSISGPQRCHDFHAKKMFELAEKYDTPYHIHICETRAQQISGSLYYNTTISKYSEKIGILAPRTTIAHSIWIDDDDIEIFAKTGVNIAHNIISNLKLGSGIMPYIKLRDAGVHMCLGCDGTSSNDTQNLLSVIKMTALLHKVTQPDFRKWPTADEIFRIATKGGARSMMRSDEIGSIEPGKKADLLIINSKSINMTPMTSIKNMIVYSENGMSIDKIIIDGKIVMDNGVITTVDEKAILREINELIPAFFQQFKNTEEGANMLFPYLEKMYERCIEDPDPLWRFSSSRQEYPFKGRVDNYI